MFESYHGAHYNCNPRGIYEAMRQDERYLDYTFVWAFKNPGKYAFLKENLNTVLVRSCSRRHYMFCARAKYLVSNLLLRPQISLKREQCYIQTWHGKPIKKLAAAKPLKPTPTGR